METVQSSQEETKKQLSVLKARIEEKGYDSEGVETKLKSSCGITTTDPDVFEYAKLYTAIAFNIPTAAITITDQINLQETLNDICIQLVGRIPVGEGVYGLRKTLKEQPFLCAVSIDQKLDPSKLSNSAKTVADMVRSFTSQSYKYKTVVLAESSDKIPVEISRNLLSVAKPSNK